MLHKDPHAGFKTRVDAEFSTRYAFREHDGLSVAPAYLMRDADSDQAPRDDSGEILTVSSSMSDAQRLQLHEDGQQFVSDYMKDAQYVFSRVQHHCHQKTSKGYVPFKACRVKRNGKCKGAKAEVCKGGFPKTKLIINATRLVCRGLAKKYGLRVTGRRNQLGNKLGKRSCEWQSGTTPAFAVVSRSNSHTLPNYRAPLSALTHEDDGCNNAKCKDSCEQPAFVKKLSKLSQRVSRECAGYHSGCTFKRQPVGVKYLDAASETLNYVIDGMQQKNAAQKYHYITHRMMQDMQHRCIARTAPEEWNLAANWHEHDAKNAEFIRSFEHTGRRISMGTSCCVASKQKPVSMARGPSTRCCRTWVKTSLTRTCTCAVLMTSMAFAVRMKGKVDISFISILGSLSCIGNVYHYHNLLHHSA